MPPSPVPEPRRTVLRPLPLARHSSPGFPPRGTVWVVERLGRFSRLVYSGRGAPLLPLLDKVVAAFSTRRIDYATPPHGILVSTPHLALRVHANWHLRVADPKRLAYRISDVDRCIDMLVHTRVRDTLNAQPGDAAAASAPVLERMSETVRAGVDATSQKFGIVCPAFHISAIERADNAPPPPPLLPQAKSLVLADALPGGVAENDLGEVESVLPELPGHTLPLQTLQRTGLPPPPPPFPEVPALDTPDDDSSTENHPPLQIQRDVLYAPPPSPTGAAKLQPDNSDMLPQLLGRVMNHRQQVEEGSELPGNTSAEPPGNTSAEPSPPPASTTFAPSLARYLDALPPPAHVEFSSDDDSDPDPQDEVEVFASRSLPANRPAPIPVNLSDDDHPRFRGDYPQPLHTERFGQRIAEVPLKVPSTSQPPQPAAPPASLSMIDASGKSSTDPVTTSASLDSAAPPPYSSVAPALAAYSGMPPPPPPPPSSLPASYAEMSPPPTSYSDVSLPPTSFATVAPPTVYSVVAPSPAFESMSSSLEHTAMGGLPQLANVAPPTQLSSVGHFAPQNSMGLPTHLETKGQHAQGEGMIPSHPLNEVPVTHFENYELPQVEPARGALSTSIEPSLTIESERQSEVGDGPVYNHDPPPVPIYPQPQDKAEVRDGSDGELSSTDAVRDEEMAERSERRHSGERSRNGHPRSSSAKQEPRKRRQQVPTSSIFQKVLKSAGTTMTSDLAEGHTRNANMQSNTPRITGSSADKASDVKRKTSKPQASKSGTREAPRRAEREKKKFAGSSESPSDEHSRPSWPTSGRPDGSDLEDTIPRAEVDKSGPSGTQRSVKVSAEDLRVKDQDKGNSTKETSVKPSREKDAEWLRSKEEEEILSHKEHVRRGKLMDVLESIEKSHAESVAGHDSSANDSQDAWVDAVASDSDTQFYGDNSIVDVPAEAVMELSNEPSRRRSKSRSHHRKESREQAGFQDDSSSDDGVCHECEHHHRQYHHSDSHSSRGKSHSRRMHADEEDDDSDHVSEHRSTSSSRSRSRSERERRTSEENRRSDHSSRDRSHRSKKSSRDRKNDREHSSSSRSRSGDKKRSHQRSSSKSRKSSSRDAREVREARDLRDGDHYDRKRSKSKSKSKPRKPSSPPATMYALADADPGVASIYRHRLPHSEEETVNRIPWYCEGQSAAEETTDPEQYPGRRSSEEESHFESAQTTTTYSSYGQRDKYGRRHRAHHNRRVTFLYDNS